MNLIFQYLLFTGISCWQAPRAEVEYQLWQRAERPQEWEIRVSVRGLDPQAGPVAFRLQDWGGWSEVDSLYLERVASEPPSEPPREANSETVGLWTLQIPEDWDGRASFHYRLHLPKLDSKVQRRLGLLPTRAPDYAFGFRWNTLVEVLQRGEPIPARRTLEIHADNGSEIVTGWGGRSRKKQRVELAGDGGNGPIAIGRIAAQASGRRGDFKVEVFQFGQGGNAVDTVLQCLLAVGPELERIYGIRLPRPYRAFLTDTQGGGMGSRAGLRLGAQRQDPPGEERGFWFRQLIVHELLHHYNGILLREINQDSLWFKEGFTDYLALWHATAVGQVPRSWFAERIQELDAFARQRSAFGRVSFLEPGGSWRDGDGPLETMAYSGAAVMAFAADAELRSQGKPGLVQILRDLLAAEENYGIEQLQSWFEQNGLQAFWKQAVAGTEVPSAKQSLLKAGWTQEGQEVSLTYFGIAVDLEDSRRIAAVDPNGPAAKAGIQAGDWITGYYPARRTAAEVPAKLEGDYPWGLGAFLPSESGQTYVGVHREGQDLQVFLDPVLRPGGILVSLEEGPEAERFFQFAADS
ncbi:MAG: hypothetical protein DWQ01_19545 [Planctomycetota bacterium]|nr:MAG: hypothetical protein DWQ01_19545 [Planctomycetota bacterium]